MYWTTLLLCTWIVGTNMLESCSGLDLDKLPLPANLKNCAKDADCDENECCTFEAEATLTSATKISWRCKPLGDIGQTCHSLGSVHCPCKPGLRCVPKAIWFFGAGLCEKKLR